MKGSEISAPQRGIPIVAQGTPWVPGTPTVKP